ncbi:helix-turn-helix transcriptional regulator [Prevotella loescheii]|nr:helix-turn-helix transcriptional regulator [Hoylesella loescheii]
MYLRGIIFQTSKLGRDQATISKWVTNSAQPPLETLIQIVQCLDVDVQEFIRVPEHNPFKD